MSDYINCPDSSYIDLDYNHAFVKDPVMAEISYYRRIISNLEENLYRLDRNYRRIARTREFQPIDIRGSEKAKILIDFLRGCSAEEVTVDGKSNVRCTVEGVSYRDWVHVMNEKGKVKKTRVTNSNQVIVSPVDSDGNPVYSKKGGHKHPVAWLMDADECKKLFDVDENGFIVPKEQNTPRHFIKTHRQVFIIQNWNGETDRAQYIAPGWFIDMTDPKHLRGVSPGEFYTLFAGHEITKEIDKSENSESIDSKESENSGQDKGKSLAERLSEINKNKSKTDIKDSSKDSKESQELDNDDEER